MDDIWKEMNEADKVALGKYSKNAIVTNIPQVIVKCDKKKATGSGKKKKEVVDSNIPKISKSKSASGSRTTKASSSSSSSGTAAAEAPAEENSTDAAMKKFNELPESETTPAELLQLIGRDITNIDDTADAPTKKAALQRLYNELFVKTRYSVVCYNMLFRELSKPLFKRFADDAEKCRELSFKLVNSLLLYSTDIQPILPYYIPALFHRLPSPISFDEEMKVFVYDMESHDAYRRGKAISRQDANSALSAYHCNGKEPAEEIRLLATQGLGYAVRRAVSIGACHMIHPFFHEIIIFLQAQLRDSFPDLKVEACMILELLAMQEDFNIGMKYFSVALCRAIFPILRHRHAKVRASGVSCLRACMCVPDKDKVKGSGTEAIMDLVGFREENNLSVASFYAPEVRVNYLAELVVDPSVVVKEQLVGLLTMLLTQIGDRYDHQTRLVPYLLDLLTDDAPTVAENALNCLKFCGKQYEEEHPNDIIEKRQYGVDGDVARINLDKPPVPPFKERPRVGVRLYTRGNVKRFLTALMNELTNWITHTRIKSAHLLKLVVYLCEEHLTMEAHTMFPSFIKAIHFARQDGDKALHQSILEVCEVVGRYTMPETYIHFVLPRLRGDIDVLQYGNDVNMRISILQMLSALLSGSRPSNLVEYFAELVTTLTNPMVIDVDSSPALRMCALDVILTLLHAMMQNGRGKAAIEAHFLATGRLTSLQTSVYKLFHYLLTNISTVSDVNSSTMDAETLADCQLIRDRSTVAMILLAALDSATVPVIPGLTTKRVAEASIGEAATSTILTTGSSSSAKNAGGGTAMAGANKLCSLVLVGINDVPLATYRYSGYVYDLQRLFSAHLRRVFQDIVTDTTGGASGGAAGEGGATLVEEWPGPDAAEQRLLCSIVECPLLLHSIDAPGVYQEDKEGEQKEQQLQHSNSDRAILSLCQGIVSHCCDCVQAAMVASRGTVSESISKEKLAEIVTFYTRVLTMLVENVSRLGCMLPGSEHGHPLITQKYTALFHADLRAGTSVFYPESSSSKSAGGASSSKGYCITAANRRFLVQNLDWDKVVQSCVLLKAQNQAAGQLNSAISPSLKLLLDAEQIGGGAATSGGITITNAAAGGDSGGSSGSSGAKSTKFTLQITRLRLLSALLDTSNELCAAQSMSALINNSSNSPASNGSSVNVPPILFTAAEALVARQNCIVNSLQPLITTPQCAKLPLSMRVDTVKNCIAVIRLAEAATKCQQFSIASGADFDAWSAWRKTADSLDDYPRVKSFKSEAGAGAGKASGAAGEQVSAASTLLPLLIQLLDDSNNALRLQVAESMKYLVPQITADVANAPVPQHNSFSAVLRALLVHLIKESGYLPSVTAADEASTSKEQVEQEELVASLDGLVRAVVVRDCVAAEVAIRAQWEAYSEQMNVSGGGKTNNRVSEFVSGLLDHCDLLRQFN